jgi:hypothetical protein
MRVKIQSSKCKVQSAKLIVQSNSKCREKDVRKEDGSQKTEVRRKFSG